MYTYNFKILENFEPSNQEQRSELVEFLRRDQVCVVKAESLIDAKSQINKEYPRISSDNFMLAGITEINEL